MTAPTFSNSTSLGKAGVDEAPAFIDGCFLAGPSLSVGGEGSCSARIGDWKSPVKIKTPALKLSLDALCIDAPTIPEEKIKLLPPGPFDFHKLAGLAPPPGLSVAPPPGLSESDTSTTVGGASDADTSDSDEMPSPKICLNSLVGNGLVLSEVSELKATAPMFRPQLSPSAAALLMPDVIQQTPLRTKLRAKAELYVPAPFVPMAAVNESWQNWHMQNSSYDQSCDGWQSGEEYIRMAKDILDKDVDGWQSGEDWLRMAKMTEVGGDSHESAEMHCDQECTDQHAMTEW